SAAQNERRPSVSYWLQWYTAFVDVECRGELQENQRKTESGWWRQRASYRRAVNVFVLVVASVSLAAARDLALVSNKSNTLNAMTVADLVKVCKAQTYK